jgi:hypothetical protein
MPTDDKIRAQLCAALRKQAEILFKAGGYVFNVDIATAARPDGLRILGLADDANGNGAVGIILEDLVGEALDGPKFPAQNDPLRRFLDVTRRRAAQAGKIVLTHDEFLRVFPELLELGAPAVH